MATGVYYRTKAVCTRAVGAVHVTLFTRQGAVHLHGAVPGAPRVYFPYSLPVLIVCTYGAGAGAVTHFSRDHFLRAPSIVGRRPTGILSSLRDSSPEDVLGFSS